MDLITYVGMDAEWQRCRLGYELSRRAERRRWWKRLKARTNELKREWAVMGKGGAA